MLVKISYDEGATFDETCDLRDIYVGEDLDEEYFAARNELERIGRYWEGGGAAPLVLIMKVR